MIKGLVIFLGKTINDSSADALEILRALIHLLQPWPNVPEGTNCDFWQRDNGIHSSQSKPKLFIPKRIHMLQDSQSFKCWREKGASCYWNYERVPHLLWCLTKRYCSSLLLPAQRGNCSVVHSSANWGHPRWKKRVKGKKYLNIQ